MKKLALLSLALALTSVGAQAQPVTNPAPVGVAGAYNSSPPTCTNTQFCFLQVDVNGQLKVAASLSVSGFPTVQTTGTPISVTTGGVTGTLPNGTVVVATNVGATNGAYCKLGASATTSDQYITAGGGWFAFTVGANTQLTCITSTSTTTVNMVGGTGLPTGTGGGTGSAGGGGAITAASGAYASGSISAGALAAGSAVDGWNLSEGATTATAATVGSAGTVQAKLRLMTSQLDAINTSIQGPIPACSASPCTTVIGAVVPFQGTTALSATNGLFANQLQGNAVLSATNGAFTNLLQGNAVLSATNPLPTLHVGTGYETVAASVTAQVLGGSGATGDYLSHCVIYPTSVSPGVVTVFDNANAAGTNAIAFPGGTTSLSNLAPIAIPVGAISTAGPWKVTTGANLVVTCYGRFT